MLTGKASPDSPGKNMKTPGHECLHQRVFKSSPSLPSFPSFSSNSLKEGQGELEETRNDTSCTCWSALWSCSSVARETGQANASMCLGHLETPVRSQMAAPCLPPHSGKLEGQEHFISITCLSKADAVDPDITLQESGLQKPSSSSSPVSSQTCGYHMVTGKPH